jgi:hypothetical protein
MIFQPHSCDPPPPGLGEGCRGAMEACFLVQGPGLFSVPGWGRVKMVLDLQSLFGLLGAIGQPRWRTSICDPLLGSVPSLGLSHLPLYVGPLPNIQRVSDVKVTSYCLYTRWRQIDCHPNTFFPSNYVRQLITRSPILIILGTAQDDFSIFFYSL